MKKVILSLIIVTTIIFTACNSGTSKQEKSTETYAELVAAAKDAYIFSYPMVMMYRSMHLQALNTKSGVGMGNWLHLGLSVPQDTTIVTPNVDSPYSYAWVDLRTEPYVVTLPKIEKNRFYTSQWDDMFGYVIDNAGSVNDGNEGVSIMLVSPDYKGELPKGIKRMVKGDSYLMGSLTRTQIFGAEDLPKVKEIQSQYKLQTLSSYLGTETPKLAPKVEWMNWEEGVEFKDGFWKFAGFVSQFMVNHPEDKAKWENLKKFGFELGKGWDVSKLDAKTIAALKQGQKEALNHLSQLASKSFDPKKFFNSREGMKSINDNQYDQRALGVLAGIFGNTKDISVYYGYQSDKDGNIPDASKSPYTLNFKKGELPQVKNFWSLTMYRLPQRWFVPNEIERYSIGSASPEMNENEDGSLTIYLQTNNPGKDKEGNWLPTPDGPFWIVLRCYGPDQSVIEGTWPEPILAPVK